MVVYSPGASHQRAMLSHFSAIGPLYRDLRTTDEAPVRLIGRRLDGMPSVRAADIGCGAGRYDRLLLEQLRGLHLTCVDINPVMLQQTAALLRARGFHDDFEMLHSSVEDLSLEEGSLDCVFTFNAIHHFPLPAFFDRVRTAVRDGGRIFVYTRLPDQNARTIWGRHFPEFTERETRLYDLAELHRCVVAGDRLHFQRTTCFRFPRRAHLDRLLEQARAAHYSTFALYGRDEFETALGTFERSLLREFDDPARIEWYDENILLEVRRFDS